MNSFMVSFNFFVQSNIFFLLVDSGVTIVSLCRINGGSFGSLSGLGQVPVVSVVQMTLVRCCLNGQEVFRHQGTDESPDESAPTGSPGVIGIFLVAIAEGSF